MTYIDKFIDSMKNLEKYEPDFKGVSRDYTAFKKWFVDSTDKNTKFYQFLDENLEYAVNNFIKTNPYPLDDICHFASHFFQIYWKQNPEVKEFPAFVTVGNVEYKDKKMYKATKFSVDKIIKAGFDPEVELDLHVWITFPDMTVLDLTIIQALRKQELITTEEYKGKDFYVWSEGKKSNMKYYPILQDNNFLTKVDKLSI